MQSPGLVLAVVGASPGSDRGLPVSGMAAPGGPADVGLRLPAPRGRVGLPCHRLEGPRLLTPPTGSPRTDPGHPGLLGQAGKVVRFAHARPTEVGRFIVGSRFGNTILA